MTYTIKEIASLAGVTTRTIRYYDQIGLLSPVHTGDNGYRYYDDGSLLRLQQILFFRELEVPLKDIELIINRPDFNPAHALEEHRAALRRKAERLARLIATVEMTIASFKGERTMTEKDYFAGFDESQYEDEARQRWGDTPQYAESQKKWGSYSREQKAAIKAEGRRLTVRMVGQDADTPPDDPDVQTAIAAYHAYLNKYFYTCSLEQLLALAEMWAADERFAANYERVRPGGAAFVRQAVQAYCERND